MKEKKKKIKKKRMEEANQMLRGRKGRKSCLARAPHTLPFICLSAECKVRSFTLVQLNSDNFKKKLFQLSKVSHLTESNFVP